MSGTPGAGTAAGTDTGGVPWAGRELPAAAFAGDTGEADPRLEAALAAWSGGTGDQAEVVAALAVARVLVPVLAVAPDAPAGTGPGAEEQGARRRSGAPPAGDAGADMAVALLGAPDGRRALPVFTGLAALTAWRPGARPVPVEAARAALSAVREGCDLLVVDPAGPVTHVVRRPAVEALAQGRPWLPPWRDPELAAAVARAAEGLPGVVGVRCEPGTGAELRLVVGLARGRSGAQVQQVTDVLGERLAAEAVVAQRVDSLELRVLPA